MWGAVSILGFWRNRGIFHWGFANLRGDCDANAITCQPSWKLRATAHLNKVTH
jgi:hypothetical protein